MVSHNCDGRDDECATTAQEDGQITIGAECGMSKGPWPKQTADHIAKRVTSRLANHRWPARKHGSSQACRYLGVKPMCRLCLDYDLTPARKANRNARQRRQRKTPGTYLYDYVHGVGKPGAMKRATNRDPKNGERSFVWRHTTAKGMTADNRRRLQRRATMEITSKDGTQ